MYESGLNTEGAVDCDLLFCQACLTSNRALTSVGDYIDVYLKICENSRLTKTSQINLCWECIALLKKVRAFKKKVENAQKILEYRVNKQAPLEDSLSNLTPSNTELTTYIPIFILDDNEDEDEDENEVDKSNVPDAYDPKAENDKDDSDKSIVNLEDYVQKEVSKNVNEIVEIDCDDPKDELMIKIADVRGQCDIVDENPVLNVTGAGCGVRVKVEPLSPEENEIEQRYQRWKRSVMLVHKRICGHKYARYFLRPVTDELAPDYSRVVRRPTDLLTIKRRVREGLIRTTKEFRHALLLMFSNSLMYNGSEYNIYDIAMEIRDATLRELEILEAAEAHAISPLFPLPPPRRRAPSPSLLSCAAQPPRRIPPARPVSPPTLPPSPPDPRPVSPPTWPPSRPVSPAPLAAPVRRKRWDWSAWPEHEQLLAIKKYKTTVVL